jgi:hypothetical protein
MYQTRSPQESKRQHCPACFAYVKFSNRYPSYCCQKCVSQSLDKNGRSVRFLAANKVGRSCEGLYEKGEQYYLTICFVKGIKCKVEESALSEVVIFPVQERARKPNLIKPNLRSTILFD